MALKNSTVSEGTILECNDKRFLSRRVIVTKIVKDKNETYAQYKARSRYERINFRNIHDAGTNGSRGWRVAQNQRIKGTAKNAT